MSTAEVVLAILRGRPAHGYDVKRDHDAWFPDARPLAYGQVYATLARLERDGLAEVVETRTDGGPERTVYAVTDAGRARVRDWLGEPAPAGSAGADEIVRKAVAALRTGVDAAGFLQGQRRAHLRRMRELNSLGPGADPAARLARDHLVLHLDADLRWLDLAVARVTATNRANEQGRQPPTTQEAAR
jgi:DNA-binding PadR family transcriptional regulator